MHKALGSPAARKVRVSLGGMMPSHALLASTSG